MFVAASRLVIYVLVVVFERGWFSVVGETATNVTFLGLARRVAAPDVRPRPPD